MQTFLPYASFAESARCLDTLRLGKQRVECKQILLALVDPTYGWQNHPAKRMWEGHVAALAEYMREICIEWRGRGCSDTCLDWLVRAHGHRLDAPDLALPSWLGDAAFHDSHKSNLLRKAPAHYAKFGWMVLPNLPYVWPQAREVAHA